ncbi:hypothetical protein FH972_023319 [Carpinus fangiana]|uniref:Major facilitator superfamily (MFS) profile domain-containing protein n=1 Tax=Carpinus fangiana TaxID=176857 RepID=A0A5N6KX49_9ROSI|nr:hypothetical protein FH972_023319 [Carpinus fangiana]
MESSQIAEAAVKMPEYASAQLQSVGSNDGEGEGLHLDPIDEGKLLAKLDLFFTPIIMLVYLQFSTAVSIFYATYVAFETPWAILIKKLTPRYLITGLCVTWSLVTVFSGFVENIGGLYATRLILGACEGGLFPGLNLYLTMVYRREEQAKRVSYLFVCAALAGAFGGLLAYAILHMDGVSGVAGWRWVYIIEGVISFAIAIYVYLGLPNDPSNAYFLNQKERQMMQIRAEERKEYMGSDDFDWHEVKIALKDLKLYLSTFLPSIIKGMGYSRLQSQYLTIPVYIFGGLAFLGFAFGSDRLRVPNVFGIIGYVLLLVDTSQVVKFVACFFCAVAVYTGPGLNLTWLNVNVAPHYRRATAIGMQQTIGNTAGIVAGQIYRKAPYTLGNS